MDHISVPLPDQGPHADEIRSYPAQGPKYGSTDSPLVNVQNLPTHDDNEITSFTGTFSCSDGSNGDNAHPVAEGNITFANGPEVRKTQVAPKSGSPGPM